SVLDLGSEPVGVSTASQSAVLTNSGNKALSIKSIRIVGADKGDFKQTNDCPSSLGVGKKCTINVTFTPTAIGARNATLNVTDNAPNSPQPSALSGTGIQSTVTFSPWKLTFGPQALKTTSPPQALTLSTDGILNISSITTTAQFGQTNNCGAGLPA